MAAKTKTLAEDEAMKARKKAKLMKDDADEEDGEDMACSDGGKDDADADDDKDKSKSKKMPWMKSKKKASKAADDDEDMTEDEDDDEDDDMDKSERFSVATWKSRCNICATSMRPRMTTAAATCCLPKRTVAM